MAPVKKVAIEALGAMRYERAVQALIELFQYYAKGPIGEASLDALARMRIPRMHRCSPVS